MKAVKKLICLLLAAVFLFVGVAGCAKGDTASSEPQKEKDPEYEESPEEAAVFRVLLIAQSLGQDMIWLVYDVLKAEMPDKQFMIADIYESVGLDQHRKNIESDAPAYHFYVNESGSYEHYENVSISTAISMYQWDLVIFNDSTFNTTQSDQYFDGDHKFMKEYIRKNVTPACKLGFNCMPSVPTSKELYNSPPRHFIPDGWRPRLTQYFRGSRNQYYKQICDNINRYIEKDKDYDYVFHCGTAIQYASETYGVPEADPDNFYDLYRDYGHLSDFGRLICAYQIYAQLFGKKEIKECKVDVIRADMRAVPYIQAKGDLVLTDKHKDALVQSVNFALAHPNEAPPQTARDPAILEPLE